jgi:transketolase
MQTNVKIGATHGGISVGPDGATHQALEDIAIMRALPNMKVIVPADSLQAKKATIAAAISPGPAYLRFGRSPVPYVTGDNDKFEIGKIDLLKDGKDVAIIACGVMVFNALEAAKVLAAKGISAMVLNAHTIKPIDKETIVQVAQKTGAIVTCEEHSVIGGLGSAVSEVVVKNGPVVPMEMVGTQDIFGESGEPAELMKKYHLMPEDIITAAEKAIKRKK